MRCKAGRGEENQEPVLLCSTGGLTPDIFVGTMLSKLERERVRSGEGRTCSMVSPLSYQIAKNTLQFVRQNLKLIQAMVIQNSPSFSQARR